MAPLYYGTAYKLPCGDTFLSIIMVTNHVSPSLCADQKNGWLKRAFSRTYILIVCINEYSFPPSAQVQELLYQMAGVLIIF